MDFDEVKVSYDDYSDYKRLIKKIFNILKKYKCCKPAYREFEMICHGMKLRLNHYLGE